MYQLRPSSRCEDQMIPKLRFFLFLCSQYRRVIPPLTAEVLEARALLEKDWARYKREQHLADIKMFDRINQAQQRALDELRQESEELYQEAIQLDVSLLPYSTKGPVRTPPIRTYESPDGEYIDISKKWD